MIYLAFEARSGVSLSLVLPSSLEVREKKCGPSLSDIESWAWECCSGTVNMVDMEFTSF